MNTDTEIVIFLAAQAGMLIWILSRHDAEIKNLKGWIGSVAHQGSVNGRNLGVLQGINDEKKNESGD